MVSMTRLIWSKMAKDGMKAIIRYYRKEASAQVARNIKPLSSGKHNDCFLCPKSGLSNRCWQQKAGTIAI